MKKPLLLGLVLIFILQTGVFAESEEEPNLEKLLKEALTVSIQAKLFHNMQNIMWESVVEKLTIPGRPVTVYMQNEQAKLSVHFTPYRKQQGGLILVAQSEIWLREEATDTSPENLRYFTSMKSIPLDYQEMIYFYPLGKLENLENPDQIHIEMALTISPYVITDETLAEESTGVETVQEN